MGASEGWIGLGKPRGRIRSELACYDSGPGHSREVDVGGVYLLNRTANRGKSDR